MAPTNYQVKLESSANGKIFHFRAVTPLKNKKIQPSIDIPIVNTSAADRFLFRFTGQSQDINFSYVLFDDGQDCSGDGSGIITVQQQAEYLMDVMYTHEFDTLWYITSNGQWTGAYEGIIDGIDLDTPTGGNIRTGSITFKRGRIGGL